MSFEKLIPGDTALLEILKHTKEPTAIYTSPDLRIGFINHAMMKLWQKTTLIVGKPLIDAAPEFAPFIPLLEQVWRTGKPYIAVDTPANIDRHGELTTHYFDFEYRPVFDSAGSVQAIINTTTEVTERLSTLQQLQAQDIQQEQLKNELIAANKELLKTQGELAEINLNLQLHLSKSEENELFLQRFIMQAPAALTLLRGPQLIYDIFNTKYQQLVPGRDLEGRSIFEALPELTGTPLEDILNKVYHEGTPFSIADSLVPIAEYESGPTHERYFTFNFVPWYNDKGEIDGVLNLAYEVTDHVKNQTKIVKLNDELQKVNGQLLMAAGAARIGTWFIEPDSKALTYNTVLADIFGYEGSEPMTYDQAIAQVEPEFRDHLVKEIALAIQNGYYYDVTYQHKRFNDGKVIWLRSTGQISGGENQGIIAFSGVV
ncbi:hypothetical protein GCM10023149_30190 [Mucilaginibacter gynuensis]|uniref:PAS domain S-box-containing protein n=1 Tax=Mucilaginibacter gynuensis TaxID=1302236 RepID=A0ABP8GMM4_9SPHI